MLTPGTEISITSASSLGGYRLRIRFTDGHICDINFEPFLRSSRHAAILKFLEPELFSAYRIEWGNLVWGDYDLCFPLEDLYENALAESPLQAVAENHPQYGA